MEFSKQDFMNMIQASREKEAFLNWIRNSLNMSALQEGSLDGENWLLFYGQWVKTGKPGFLPDFPANDRITNITHPEEPINHGATFTNSNVITVITKWLTDWGVPTQYWDYWKTTIDIEVYEIYPASLLAIGFKHDTPSATWEAGGKRHLAIKPQWLNPGVIAHEQAHNSYALLSPSQKSVFSIVYTSLKSTVPAVRLLYSRNTYGLTNDVEGHAEVYRYIGQQMPVQLKIFYPRLF